MALQERSPEICGEDRVSRVDDGGQPHNLEFAFSKAAFQVNTSTYPTVWNSLHRLQLPA